MFCCITSIDIKRGICFLIDQLPSFTARLPSPIYLVWMGHRLFLWKSNYYVADKMWCTFRDGMKSVCLFQARVSHFPLLKTTTEYPPNSLIYPPNFHVTSFRIGWSWVFKICFIACEEDFALQIQAELWREFHATFAWYQFFPQGDLSC